MFVRPHYVRTQHTAGWSPHSWCLILTPLSFHLCSCFPLLTFQTNLVRQTDHRCPAESLPLSQDNLSANLLILFLMNSLWITFMFTFCFLSSFFLFSLFLSTQRFSNSQNCTKLFCWENILMKHLQSNLRILFFWYEKYYRNKICLFGFRSGGFSFMFFVFFLNFG